MTRLTLDALSLSWRAYKALITLNYIEQNVGGWHPPTQKIETVADLEQWSAADLLHLHWVGRQTVDEIAAALAAHGRQLRHE
jgi:hypothetical protein